MAAFGTQLGHWEQGASAYNGDVAAVAEENPELHQGQAAHPGNGEEPNPLDADSETQADAGEDEPEPPANGEGLLGTQLMLVSEGAEGEGGESRGGDEGRVEEDQAGLGKESILCKRLG